MGFSGYARTIDIPCLPIGKEMPLHRNTIGLTKNHSKVCPVFGSNNVLLIHMNEP
jgi:hypothetical protein